MADPRFYQKSAPITLKELCLKVGCDFVGDGDILLSDVATLTDASKEHLSFLHNPKYVEALEQTKAGAVIVHPNDQAKVPEGTAAILSQAPYRTFGVASGYFYPESSRTSFISETARIHPSAKVPKSCCIEDFVVIHEGVELGENVHIKANSVISRGCIIDDHSLIEENVTIQFSKIGKNVHIKPGARIGQSGFGFHMDEKGHFPVPQLGLVIIEDNVQVGANTCIDRGSQADTVIGAGTRIDNLVQIAHNVRIGKNCVIVALVGIAGSSELGNFVVLAGQVGVHSHAKIGDGVRVAAQSGVARDIPPRMDMAGSPAVPIREWHRQTLYLKKIANKG